MVNGCNVKNLENLGEATPSPLNHPILLSGLVTSESSKLSTKCPLPDASMVLVVIELEIVVHLLV